MQEKRTFLAIRNQQLDSSIHLYPQRVCPARVPLTSAKPMTLGMAPNPNYPNSASG